jgi:hypothetical protein
MASTLNFSGIYKPEGSAVTYRYRFSKDGITWGIWSVWYDVSEIAGLPQNLSSVGRYFQYEISLRGNEDFESPVITSGVTMNYYDRQNFIVFFQPVSLDIDSDEYLASIHVSHNAIIPLTSAVTYGYSQFNTVNVEDYYSLTRPMITPDRHTIILDRFNELLLTQNYQKYTAINGGWPKNAIIEVYKQGSNSYNGELVPSSSYAANNIEGSITFFAARNRTDTFMLCVTFEPVFRMLCNVENYGPTPVIIDDIEIMYNVTKRIPVNSQGNIRHSPIYKRI